MAIKKVGFIGLGTMGAPMAKCILKKGFPLAVYDLNERAVEDLTKAGAVGYASPAEVAGNADAVCSIVPDSPQVEEVILGENGILNGAKPETMIIEMSTIDPLVTQSVAKRVRAAGLRMIDAPVCRSVIEAAKGELLILIGGSKEDYEDCRPVLECMGSTFHHCGDVGAGITMKLINNVVNQSITLALAEGFTLGTKAGFTVNQILEVLSGTAVSNKIMENIFPDYAFKGNFKPGFSLDWAHKDVGHALRMAARLGVPCPAASVTHTFQNIARSKGKGQQDFTSILSVFEELTGTTIRL
jgi:3-hydroxyisobutyrate dehydrogenase-like beta-hydroxyacid dehydrogenase